MNKKLLLVLLISALMLFCFAWVYARHSDETKGTTESQEALKELAKKMKPQIGDALPVPEMLRSGVLPRTDALTQEDAIEDFSVKGRTLLREADIEEPAEQAILDPLTYCRAWNTIPPHSAYFYDPYSVCMDTVEFYTLQDPEFDPAMSGCPYPIYPWEITDVQLRVYTSDTCTFILSAELFPIYWGFGFTFPFYPAPLAHSDTYAVFAPGGWAYLQVPLKDTICVYDRFFASVTWHNTNDYIFPLNGDTLCLDGPPDYLYGASPAFDGSGRDYISWVGYSWAAGLYNANDLYGGVFRLEAMGFTRDQNDCPYIEEYWTFKDPYLEPDPYVLPGVRYAPSGVPDFHQYDADFPNGGLAYCGPTALANCLWWMAAAGIIPPFWDDTDGDGDNWDPDEVDSLILRLATCMGTHPDSGTYIWDMDTCLAGLAEEIPLWITHEEVKEPEFDYLAYQSRLCQDVILLLGFWYEDPPGSGEWYRIGGHYVTIAGVDHILWQMAISDPALNPFCIGQGFYRPHIPPPDFSHDDAGNVSHDPYQVLPDSPSPGGVIWLPEYTYEIFPLLLQGLFTGVNVPTEFEPFQTTYVPENPELIRTEVEYAKIICPGDKRVWKETESSRVLPMRFNNEGGFDWFDWDGRDGAWHYVGYSGTLILGITPADLQQDYGGEAGAGFEPYQKWDQWTDSLEDWTFGWHHTKYYCQKGLPLDIDQYVIGAFDPEDGACEDAITVKYVIHNRGPEPLYNIEKAIYFDMDVGDYNMNRVDGMEQYCTIWSYEVGYEEMLFGLTQKPIYEDRYCCGGFGVSQPYWIYTGGPGGGDGGWNHDTLKMIMELNPWEMDPTGDQPTDVGHMLIDEPFNLDSCETYCNEYLFWAFNENFPPPNAPTLKKFLFQLLKQEGFYRGDVTPPGALNYGDVIYLANFLGKSGPAPMPFTDQGDVTLPPAINYGDVIYLANYLGKGGPAPTDYSRLQKEIDQCYWVRPSLFVDDRFKDLGQ